MIKNIIIAVLLITNGISLFYIYRQTNPQQQLTLRSEAKNESPRYHYRVLLKNGGIQEGASIMKKRKTTDLISKNQMITTIANTEIERIEKVYHSAKTTKQ